jgi:hypothetical protein
VYSNPNLKPSDRITLLGAIDPDANAAGALSTDWVNAALHESLLALIAAGDLGASATLDAKLEQAQDSSGTGAKDITGKSITQLTQAGTDSNKQVFINCQSEDLDRTNRFSWVRLTMAGATATSDYAGFLFGMDSRFGGGSHASTVDEVVG